ncbi:hypothetical protein JG688_00017428 [Phytophthora aleatoria]|uniref:Uncharacterized protein n=1 Tax=Phytophthora aleatoria TaxID=2496075 RepID=A0A8J5LYJ7_9STRA|nr:hypothetical protein JG688_00017428 [Phytophthora aleatoria]
MQENALPEDFPPSEKAPSNSVPVEKATQKKPAQEKPAKAPVELNGEESQEMLEESEELRSPAKFDDQGSSEMSVASDVSDSAQEIDHLEVAHGLSKCAHTTLTQREAMGLWMEVESNRTIYLGESTAEVVGCVLIVLDIVRRADLAYFSRHHELEDDVRRTIFKLLEVRWGHASDLERYLE